MKRVINTLNLAFFVLVSLFSGSSVYAGAGKSFGFFAGGVGAGALATHLISKRKRDRYRRPQYVEVQTVQQPVQVQTNGQTQQLIQQIKQQEQEIARLNEKLTKERKQNKRAHKEFKETNERLNELEARLSY